MTDRIAVVGGGPAGLAAATWLARSGAAVTLFERAPQPGGRATSREVQGRWINQGPHALYRTGAAMAALRDLGIRPAGWRPPNDARGLRGALDAPLPAGPLALATTPLLTASERWAWVRLAAAALTRPAAGLSVADWLDRQAPPPAVRQLLLASVRVATYAHDPDGLDAGVAFAQVASAIRGGVLYLDGGWQQLVDALIERAEAAGVRLVCGAPVQRLQGTWLVGPDAAFDRVVLALPLRATAALLPDHAPLQALATAATPVRAACLDVALAEAPDPSMALRLGLDEPAYVALHPRRGGSVLHVARYLGRDEAPPPRHALEALADRLQPGWRDRVLDARFATMTVASDLPRPGVPRPDADAPGLPGVAICGDWVGPTGMLLDASLASARRAVAASLARRAA